MSNFKKQKTTKNYRTVGEIICDLSLMLSPPENLAVSDAAEKYRYVNQPGAYVGKWLNATVPYMIEPMDTFTSRDFTGMIFVGPAQCGKALDINTPLATPSGWTTMGALRVGDTIFDDSGQPCRVSLATDVMHGKQCFSVHFDDATSIIADADHKWYCYDDLKERSRVLNTLEMSATVKYGARNHRNRYAIQNAGALQLPKIPLPIDPYTLGVWLGDGHAYSGQLCLRGEDMAPMTDRIRSAGHAIESRHDEDQNSYTVAVDPNPDNSLTTTLRKTLHSLGLLSTPDWQVGKHIPAIYQRASVEQRWALLQGLNDTDGTVSKSSGLVEFSSSDYGLASGYLQLCRGLGIKPQMHEKIPTFSHKGLRKEGKASYTISWSPSAGQKPFTLERQLAKLDRDVVRRPSHTNRRRVVDVIPVESRPVRCIQVDAESHLFLAGRQMVPTHNTDGLILNTITYSVKVDPMDMIVFSPGMIEARDFGLRRVDRLHRHSVEVGKMLLPTADADNRFDKQYTTGMLLTLSWPTPATVAGKPIGRAVITDRDRMDDSIGGDGEVFDLVMQRTTTFGSYAMTVAESSPSREVSNPKWIPSPKAPHEAPPCEGILKLYNRGDRRRWQWPCPECGKYFEGMFKHLEWDTEMEGSNLDRASTVRMKCPHCQFSIHSDQREWMQARGRWVREGQGVLLGGEVFGPAPRTSIASFWLRGVAAAFVSWRKLLEVFLNANDEYERSGSEESLRKFWNNNMGEPYTPKSLNDMRLPEVLKARAENLKAKKVPQGVRFLVATIDVQKNMFVVQVFGVLPGIKFDMVIVDRFDIRKSQRTDDDGERLWVKPNTYIEDWDEITEHVIKKEYELDDDSGRLMSIRFVGCDSGGRAGVTNMAYSYYRKLREENLHRRFILLKGDASPNQPRARISYPDSTKKDNKAGARGDIPLLLLNSNVLKDDLDGRLDCLEPGKGMYRFSDWLSDSFFAELCVEVRTDKGWENLVGHSNEATDLSYYCIGICVSELIRVESINWAEAPGWAAEWDRNDFIRLPEKDVPFANGLKSAYDFASFGKALA